MNRDIKDKWVAALRSGEYEQGKGRLREGDKFCCLGVLCDIYAQTHPDILVLRKNKGYYMGQDSYLPNSVMGWAELKGINPYINNTLLSHFNDEVNLNFEQIALLIEENL